TLINRAALGIADECAGIVRAALLRPKFLFKQTLVVTVDVGLEIGLLFEIELRAPGFEGVSHRRLPVELAAGTGRQRPGGQSRRRSRFRVVADIQVPEVRVRLTGEPDKRAVVRRVSFTS